MSQSTVNECILSSAPKSCELDPIPSKFLIECLDSIISLIYLALLLHLASSHNASNQLLSHLFSKKRYLDHNDLNNYRPISNLCFIAKILEKHVLSQDSSYLSSHNLYSTCQPHIVKVTALKQPIRKLLMICSLLLAKATYLY